MSRTRCKWRCGYDVQGAGNASQRWPFTRSSNPGLVRAQTIRRKGKEKKGREGSGQSGEDENENETTRRVVGI